MTFSNLLDTPGVGGIVLTGRPIGERKRFESQLVYLASHDSLTGLCNRRRFEELMDEELVTVDGRGTSGALIFLDLDNFKAVNDSLGHRVGDDFLRSLAAVLRAQLGGGGILARFGGDEFAVLAPRADAVAAAAIAERLRQAVRRHTVVVEDTEISSTASIGIALFPEHGATVDDLLVHADLAMYAAKEDRDAVATFDPAAPQHADIATQRAWSQRIRDAVDRDRLCLYAQPLRHLSSGRIEFEFLVRLEGDDGQLIPPGEFLPVAERSGLVVDIDRWVVGRAISLLAEWERSGRALSVAVNLSGRSLRDGGLASFVEQELQARGADPASLMLEVTETSAITNIESAREFMARLRKLGCRFAIDDFGAGFASFGYLKYLPVDRVKIDGSYVRNLPHAVQDQHFVRAMVEVARGLGMETVAEFVEDEETLSLLTAMGVDFGQGFYIARPAPVAEALARYDDPAGDSAAA